MTDHRDMEGLEQRLVEAWKRAPAAVPTPEWKAGVMRTVRARAGDSEAAPVLTIIRNALFAAAAATVVAFVFAGGNVIDPGAEVVRLIGRDPHALLELMWVL